MSRRSFLQLGGLAIGGLCLSDLLQAEAHGATRSGRPSHKSVIMVYLAGGLADQDTFPTSSRTLLRGCGEFKPIATRLPGVQISEMLPRTAAALGKMTVIRSLVGLRDEHFELSKPTGFPMTQSQRRGKPSLGSVVAKMQGSVDPVVPPFIDLFPVMQHRPVQ